MPISDSLLYLCNIDGADLTGEGAQTAVKVGPGPANGMMLRLFANATAHASVTLEESETSGGTYTDVPLGNRNVIVMDGAPGAGEYAYAEQRIYWTKPYLRVTLGDTPTGTGDLQVALIKGHKPTPVDGA